jgi:hypothetical protein
MASLERRRSRRRDASGRVREVVRYRVRCRDAKGLQHSETASRLVDAERRKSEIEHELATTTWHDSAAETSCSGNGSSSGYRLDMTSERRHKPAWY